MSDNKVQNKNFVCENEDGTPACVWYIRQRMGDPRFENDPVRTFRMCTHPKLVQPPCPHVEIVSGIITECTAFKKL